ncbi:MAG: geranylgeranyl reductase family protein [Acidimicrobiaceae bacterium]|nr:geranylgeranyl reductase family protein [Acidimicrobiaceae bacterium]
MTSHTDVLVVGAGPAGIAAALTAKRLGMNVLVIDKATFPRDKCCGDGLTTGALRLLDQLGLRHDTVASWKVCRDVSVRSPSGRVIDLQLPDTGQFAAIATRFDLDAALVDHARECGVDIREGVSFANIESLGKSPENTNPLHEVTTSNGVITARVVIAADGMWSPVRKAMQPDRAPYLGEWHAMRQYAHHVTGPASERLYVWFEPDLLPGYAWSFPVADGRVNIGFSILRGASQKPGEMKTVWADVLSRDHVRQALGSTAVLDDKLSAWPIPARVTAATLHVGNVLFVGDAACVTDVLTGEGIGQALLSGMLAGAAAAQQQPGRAYRRAMRRHFFADHRMSNLLSRVLANERLARAALRIIDGGTWRKQKFVRWMFEDEPRASALTPRRWHRGYLSSSGAYTK